MIYHKLMLENQSLFTKMVFDELNNENITIGQPKVLEYLFTHDGAIQKNIAEACQIEPATLTSLLLRMEKNNLVERKNKNGDKRYICVYLTDYGKKKSKSVIKAFETLEKVALKDFSTDQIEQFITLLKKVNNNLMKKKGDNNSEQKRTM